MMHYLETKFIEKTTHAYSRGAVLPIGSYNKHIESVSGENS